MKSAGNHIASILIVDDMPKNIQILGNLLRQSNYNVEFAMNGPDALDWIRTHKFDLVLLDIMMPGMDGIEVCKIIKGNHATQDIPVIFITAKNDTKDITQGFEAGAIDYITKPFNTVELLARVSTHLKIQSQNKELIYQNSFKNILMSVIAHDLRTPLSIISNMIGVAKIKKDQQKTEELGETLDIIDLSIKESFHIVNDLLVWGKIQFEKVKMVSASFNLFALVNEIVFVFSVVSDEKNIKILNNVRTDVFIKTDRDMLKIILRNLLFNAIKFTPEKGEIQISYEIIENDSYSINVKDSGVGINKKKLQQLFSSEQKYLPVNTFSESGMGLGLFLCKDIVEFMSGNISIESEEGKGSTFQINLPLK